MEQKNIGYLTSVAGILLIGMVGTSSNFLDSKNKTILIILGVIGIFVGFLIVYLDNLIKKKLKEVKK